MTAKDLIEILQTLDPYTDLVILLNDIDLEPICDINSQSVELDMGDGTKQKVFIIAPCDSKQDYDDMEDGIDFGNEEDDEEEIFVDGIELKNIYLN